MAESLPVVTVPRDDEALGSGDISPEGIVVLHEVVVEELPVVEGFEGIDTTPFAVVTEPSEPSEPSAEDVIVLGSSSSEEEEQQEEEEVVELVERVAGGPPRGGMATDAGTHPVTVPSAMPIDDVPPDDTIPALPVQEDTAPETLNPNLEKEEDADDEVRVSSETTSTVVEEVVTTVEVVEVATEEVPVNVDEVLSVNETVVEAMETEAEKGEKKRLREEEEEDAVKKLKSEKEEEKIVEPKQLGPMLFTTSVELFSYFYNLLHEWTLNQDVNKYEFMVLSELVSQANPPKVGDGIAAFQVRMHPEWQSRCYYLIRKDGSEDDFSYRKCCDALMPLPASLYRKTGELDLEKLFPGQKGRNHREQQQQQQQNGGGRGGGRGDHRGGRGGGGGRFGGRGGAFGFGGGFGGRGRGGRGGGGGGRGGGGGGGRRGGRGRW